MLTKLVEKILDLDHIDNHKFTSANGVDLYSDRSMHRIKRPDQYAPLTLKVHTLTGLRDYLEKNNPQKPVLLHVIGYNLVRVIGTIDPANDNTRFEYASAVLELKGFEFNRWMVLEDFIISLQSQFVPTAEVEQILDHLGNLASEAVKENKDDRFSQSIQVRVGIRMKSEVPIKNPIVLNPWRTFREIPQPSSNCILRLKDTGGMQCALFVADGGNWQLEAIAEIKKWLQENIKDVPVIA